MYPYILVLILYMNEIYEPVDKGILNTWLRNDSQTVILHNFIYQGWKVVYRIPFTFSICGSFYDTCTIPSRLVYPDTLEPCIGIGLDSRIFLQFDLKFSTYPLLLHFSHPLRKSMFHDINPRRSPYSPLPWKVCYTKFDVSFFTLSRSRKIRYNSSNRKLEFLTLLNFLQEVEWRKTPFVYLLPYLLPSLWYVKQCSK